MIKQTKNDQFSSPSSVLDFHGWRFSQPSLTSPTLSNGWEGEGFSAKEEEFLLWTQYYYLEFRSRHEHKYSEYKKCLSMMSQFMKMLGKNEAELKKSIAYKKSLYVLVVDVNVFDLQFKFIHKSSSRVSAHLKKLTKLTLYSNLCFALDLQRKYETWSEWGLCKSEDTACYATGTRIRKRDCLSEIDPQIKVNHCVGPPAQKDWCQMPCKGNTIIWICLNIVCITKLKVSTLNSKYKSYQI